MSLRQYNRRIFDLGKQAVYIQNKMDAALQRCNIRISNYVSNVDSKGYLEVVDLLSKGCTDPADFRGVLKRELKEYMYLLDWMRKENILSDENVEEVGRTCKKINEIATSIYQGLHSRAFKQLSNLLEGRISGSRALRRCVGDG